MIPSNFPPYETGNGTLMKLMPIPVIPANDTRDKIISEMESRYPEMCNEFKVVMDEMYRLLLLKNYDYGTGNIAMGTSLSTPEDTALALTGIVVRANDKVQRLLNLVIKNRKPLNESVLDSFIDLANYGVIALTVSRGKWGK